MGLCRNSRGVVPIVSGLCLLMLSACVPAAIAGGVSAVEALVRDINARRLQEYERISKENKQPLDVVIKLAVEQVIAKLS